MTDTFRLWYDQARALFPLLPAYYDPVAMPVDDTGMGHVRFSKLNSAGLPIFLYRIGSTISKEEVFHECGHAYKALLEKKMPWRAFGQEYWDSRGFPGTYAKAKTEADVLMAGGKSQQAWQDDPNESWAEAFRIAVSLDAVIPNNEHTFEFGKGIAPMAVRAFFRSLSPAAPSPVPTPPAPIQPPAPEKGDPMTNPLPELAPIYYSQWDPDHVGQGDCVPTSAKMLVRYYTGSEPPIAEIRDAMDVAEDGVRNLARDAGITLEAARKALTDQYGVPCAAVLGRDLDLAGLLGFVRAGRPPIIFELHGDLPTRMDQGFRGLHAVWLVDVDDERGLAWVKDPDRWGDHKADLWAVGLGDLRRAWEDGAALGGGAVIPNEARKGWDDDMFTDDDRRKLNRVYDHLEAYEPLTWISRLQQWLAKAFRSLPVLQNADLSGPDVKTGDSFK